MAVLIIVSGPRAGETVEVTSDMSIGREATDLLIDDPEISRHHAMLRPVAEGVEVEDLGSTNGTWVNGERLTGPRSMRAGDYLEIGDSRLELIADPNATRVREIPGDLTAVARIPTVAPEPPTDPGVQRERAPGPASPPSPAQPQPEPVSQAIPQPPQPPEPQLAPVRYTHAGARYLLGYAEDFFGIWDRATPVEPLQRFPRTQDGWAAAWRSFSIAEPRAMPIGPGEPSPAPSSGPPPGAMPTAHATPPGGSTVAPTVAPVVAPAPVGPAPAPVAPAPAPEPRVAIPVPASTARRPTSPDNNSGQGKKAVVPPEIAHWNWGAFLLNWVWGIGNRTRIALLTLVPGVGFVMPFVLGAKGSRWAWQNRPWGSVDHFRRVQRRWAVAGVIVAPIVVAAVVVVLLLFVFNGGGAGTEVPAGFVLHRDALAGYAIALPKDAKIQPAGGDNIALQANLSGKAPHTTLIVTKFTIKSGVTLANEAAIVKAGVQRLKTASQLVSRTVTLAGGNAVNLTFLLRDKKLFNETKFVLAKSHLAFVLTFVTPARDKTPATTIQQVADSFRFLAAGSPPPATTPAAVGSALSMADNTFSPATLTIKAGQKLTLTNNGPSLHNFSLPDAGIDVDVPAGTSKVVTIDVGTGTHAFFCKYHKVLGMTGTLTVS